MALARAEIELKASICTDTPWAADLFVFGDKEAKHLTNTGMERNGGLTPVYEKEETFATAGLNSMFTKSGDLLQVDASNNVRFNDAVIGNVGALSVYQRGLLPAFADAAWTADGTILGISRAGTVVTISEWSPATGTVINSRTVTFAGISGFVITNLSLIKYVDMHYVDNQEFLISIPGNAYRLLESGTSTTALGGILTVATFGFKFGAAKYLVAAIQNEASGNLAWLGDIGSWTTISSSYAWVTIDRFPGTAYARAFVGTAFAKQTGNILSSMFYVGYSSGGVWSATPTYLGPNIGADTLSSKNNEIAAQGYAECAYALTGSATQWWYYYAPEFISNPASGYATNYANTKTSLNAYGKLTGLLGNTSCVCDVRICMINGVPSYISAANKNTNNQDCLGVPITNVGEFDPSFIVLVDDNNSTYTRLVYRYEGRLYYVEIRNDKAHAIQKVSDTLYQVNTLSPYNLVDTTKKAMLLGANDFNGRLVKSSAPGVLAGTYRKVVAVIRNAYSGSVDTGDALVDTNSGSNFPVGVDIPSFFTDTESVGVDVFWNDVYLETFFSGGAAAVSKAKFSAIDTLYVTDTRLPIAMGHHLGEGVLVTEVETIFLGVGVSGSADVEYSYAGYELGNDIPGVFDGFLLFGQRYLFDGRKVYLASFSGPTYSGKEALCPAHGMTLIAVSPTVAYFYSAFDNSIYTYDGGRVLAKFTRMNDTSTILQGVYNVRDNSLVMDTTTSLLWVRDGIVSENTKKAAQTGLGLYDTEDGIIIANNTQAWRYTFFTLAGSTVIPLEWQSGYFGVTENKLGVVSSFVATLYSASRAASSVMVTILGFDADGEWSETHPVNIKASDWTPLGFYRHRIVPEHTLGLGISIGIQTADRLVLNSVVAEFTPSVAATPAASRST
jgi:hypothetical protein